MVKENQQTPLNKQINQKYKTKNNRGGYRMVKKNNERMDLSRGVFPVFFILLIYPPD
jgi:hypothetical protein